MSGITLSLSKEKQRLRLHMREERHRAFHENSFADKQLCDVFKNHIHLGAGLIVSAYCSFRCEMNPALLVEDLRSKGYTIALPVIVGKGEPLNFRRYNPDDRLTANSMGILEPDTALPPIDPDILLVPLLAFDHRLYRLGYGGGFYDRTINDIRRRKQLLTIGLAYACQRIDWVPVAPNDVRLDKVVTETEIFT